MKTVTGPVYAKDSLLKFAGNYEEIDKIEEASEAAQKMGLTVADINQAFRKAKKLYYIAALESTPETRLAAMKTALENTGAFDADEINVMIESARKKAKDSLPAGLVPVLHPEDYPDPTLRGKQVVGKLRGRAAANAKAEDKPAA